MQIPEEIPGQVEGVETKVDQAAYALFFPPTIRCFVQFDSEGGLSDPSHFPTQDGLDFFIAFVESALNARHEHHSPLRSSLEKSGGLRKIHPQGFFDEEVDGATQQGREQLSILAGGNRHNGSLDEILRKLVNTLKDPALRRQMFRCGQSFKGGIHDGGNFDQMRVAQAGIELLSALVAHSDKSNS